MKKRILSLILAILLLNASPACAFNDNFYGEWLYYGSLFVDGECNPMRSLTRADSFASDGILNDGFIFHEDGTVDIRSGGEIIDTGTWIEATIDGDEEGNYLSAIVTDSSGTVMQCAFDQSMMYCSASMGDLTTWSIYYKPNLYSMASDELIGRAWTLSSYYIEDYYESDLGGKYDAVPPTELKQDFRFVLHDNGSASMLVNFVPCEGEWSHNELTLFLFTPDGTEYDLELQCDDSLFGTRASVLSDSEPQYVSCTALDSLDFSETPASLESQTGSWHMTGLRDELLFYYPTESLTFTQNLEISTSSVTLRQNGQNGSRVMELTPTVVGGPVLDEDDTGTVLIGTHASGEKVPLWLLTDGTLCWKQPGSLTIYYARD